MSLLPVVYMILLKLCMFRVHERDLSSCFKYIFFVFLVSGLCESTNTVKTNEHEEEEEEEEEEQQKEEL